jgi:hypothetical protein
MRKLEKHAPVCSRADTARHERNQGLPGQDLRWPCKFVFGYPVQESANPVKEGPTPPMGLPAAQRFPDGVSASREESTRIWRVCRGAAAAVGDEPGIAQRADGRPLEDRCPIGAGALRGPHS